jgi:hypothetical protein
MNSSEKSITGPIGLDIGTSRIVIARREEKKHRFQAAYLGSGC